MAHTQKTVATPTRAWRTAFAALRAPRWAHFVVLPAAGVSSEQLTTTAGASRLALAGLVAAAALSYAYGLNSIADRRTDGPDKNPLARSNRPSRAVLFVVGASAVTTLALAQPLGVIGVAAAAASLSFGTAYSVGPRLKHRPWVGLLGNAGIFTPLTFLVLTPEQPPAHFPLLVTTFLVVLTQNQLLHERADAVEDAQANARTTGRVLGVAWTLAAVVTLAVGFAVCVVALFFETPTLVAITIATLAAGSGVALLVRDHARRRRMHGWAALIGGATLYAVSLWS